MPKINKRPQITERSEAREDVSSLMRLNWLEDASNNAVGYANKYPRDPFKTEATIELRDAARLLLVLMQRPGGKRLQGPRQGIRQSPGRAAPAERSKPQAEHQSARLDPDQHRIRTTILGEPK
ncbi:hypothetical protein KDJ07_gp35 [Arthrobacter phage Urla]|uniref:Uncharacterized protein n=1 Tax=Arthrobacter phage Urla TaxID=2047867 RepID=A0A2H4P9J9_9CAUD|nr:hypothetical protein KDJ07_gp35 [Arthrobacter phage Urla]ATW58749.1 hypothetical protein PHIRE_URLA_35 [Arthrobacter phage Urla]